MARRYEKPIRKFDKSRFADLVKEAVGNRTQKQFSEDTGLSIYYINRIIKGKLDKAPRPNTIFVIASSAENGKVSFVSLLSAAGYDESIASEFSAPIDFKRKAKVTSAERDRFVKLGIATISMALARSRYMQCYVDSGKPLENYDFVVHLRIGGELVRWQVEFLLELTPREKQYTVGFVYFQTINGEEVQRELPVIHTFVTESEFLYEKIASNAPSTSAPYASVMLIDPVKLIILKTKIIKGEEGEEFFPRFDNNSNESGIRIVVRDAVEDGSSEQSGHSDDNKS